MAYVLLADVRAEGVPETMASDSRVTAAIADVCRRAEDICRTWFEERLKTITLDGNGRDRIRLPHPCTDLTSVTLDDVALVETTDVYLRVDPQNVLDVADELARKSGATFTVGRDNLVIVGKFGTVDKSGGSPVTPADLKRALTRWVILLLPEASDEDAHLERRQLTASSFSTPGRSLSLPTASAPWSGDPEVDKVVAKYRRSMRAGIV